MRRIRFAVPPGVGDVYWCLTKMAGLRAKWQATSIELCVQAAGPARALEWAALCPQLVQASSYLRFRPNPEALAVGYTTKQPGVHAVLWPNAVVDQGAPLMEWLRDVPYDDRIEIRAPDMGRPGDVLVYASSPSINQAWIPYLGANFWLDVIEDLGRRFGKVTLIGAQWDAGWTDTLARERRAALAHDRRIDFEDLTGKTTLPQVAGLIRDARLLVGVISGMTILANHFRTPCAALMADKHTDAFSRSWVAADAPYLAYRHQECPPALEFSESAAALARAA